MIGLTIQDLTVEYDRAGYIVRAIDSLSVRATDGQLVLLLGPSGCGKTTLLSCLAGILKPTAGSIRLGDIDVTALQGPALDEYRRRTVGIVFQAFNLIPSLTALENVMAPLRLSGTPAPQARARARALLEQVGLTDRIAHRPAGLSGGQQQRVAVARGLAMDPPLILADEPTAHLDYIQVEGLLRLLRELAAPGRIMLVATHDDRMVPLADHVVELAPRFGAPSRPPEGSTFAEGDIIFEQGSRGELIYVVEDGSVDIVREYVDGREELLATIGAGDYFGELGPMLGFPRTATARARSSVQVTGYTLHDFRQRAGGDPRIAATMGRGDGAGSRAQAPRLRTRSTGAKKVKRTAKTGRRRAPAAAQRSKGSRGGSA